MGSAPPTPGGMLQTGDVATSFAEYLVGEFVAVILYEKGSPTVANAVNGLVITGFLTCATAAVGTWARPSTKTGANRPADPARTPAQPAESALSANLDG